MHVCGHMKVDTWIAQGQARLTWSAQRMQLGRVLGYCRQVAYVNGSDLQDHPAPA